MDKYLLRGVSALKEDVHAAISNIDKGIFPNAFCKVLPDYLSQNPDSCCIMHSDTAGTKGILHYLYWKETGDLSRWQHLLQDAVVMNTDDMACSGLYNDMVLSCTISRNKNLINGDVIKALIAAQATYAEDMKKYGVNLYFAGGETADVGDVVRTIDVGITATATGKRSAIKNIQINPNQVIVGLSSCGKASYEKVENSGIGCNGLTSARHDLLHSKYKKSTETYDPNVPDYLCYNGKFNFEDKLPDSNLTIADALLSPTRTYLPIISKIWASHYDQIGAMIHCTGGGLTKVMHFVHNPVHIIKDNLLPIPAIFNTIKSTTETTWKEMFRTYNMGCRLEVYCNVTAADNIVKIAQSFDIEANIIGRVESSDKPKLSLKHDDTILEY